MTFDEISNALEGLYAYDSGCVDSGIRDENLRQHCKDELNRRVYELSRSEYRMWVARLVRDSWLSEVALNEGYGLADALAFIDWLDTNMNFVVN